MVLLAELKEGIEKGTYVGVRFTKESNDAINKFKKENKIPANDKSEYRLHCTVLYSRKHVNYDPTEDNKKEIKAKSAGFDAFDDGDAIVMRLSSSGLGSLNKKLMGMGGTSDYKTYKPHVTLSYNGKGFDVKSLPEFKTTLKVENIYVTDLDD